MILYQQRSGYVDKGGKMAESLGKYIIDLRKKKLNIDVSRQMAEKLGITPQYMHDIENDNRIPSEKVLKKIEEVFSLDEEEKEKIYDMAAAAYKNNKVPMDIANYIINNSEAKSKIRKMMKQEERRNNNGSN